MSKDKNWLQGLSKGKKIGLGVFAFFIGAGMLGSGSPERQNIAQQNERNTQQKQEIVIKEQKNLEKREDPSPKPTEHKPKDSALNVSEKKEAAVVAPKVTTPKPVAPKPAPAQTSSSAGVVKRSKNSICHAPGTTYYAQTKNFTPYNTLEACLASGARLPKR